MSSRLMVVDDEPGVAEVLRRLLVKEGYNVDVFSGGAGSARRRCRPCVRIWRSAT